MCLVTCAQYGSGTQWWNGRGGKLGEGGWAMGGFGRQSHHYSACTEAHLPAPCQVPCKRRHSQGDFFFANLCIVCIPIGNQMEAYPWVATILSEHAGIRSTELPSRVLCILFVFVAPEWLNTYSGGFNGLQMRCSLLCHFRRMHLECSYLPSFWIWGCTLDIQGR